MTAMINVAQAIADRVTTAPAGVGEIEGPVDLVYGDNCREGPERKATTNQSVTGAVPHECVFVVPTGSFADEPFRGGDPAATPRTTAPEDWPGIEKPTGDVIVRSPVNNWDRGYQLATVCRRAIDKTSITGFFDVRAPFDPTYIREDEENHHLFSFPVELKHCQ